MKPIFKSGKMKPIFKSDKKIGKSKPIDEVEEEDLNPKLSKFTAKSVKAKNTPTGVKPVGESLFNSNRDIREGKIHIETLFSVFDRYRQNMNNTAYKAGQNPFLLERLVAETRLGLQKELQDMGFADILDFTFIPMPPRYTVADIVKASKSKEDEDN